MGVVDNEIIEICKYAESKRVELEYGEMGFATARKGNYRAIVDLLNGVEKAKSKIDMVYNAYIREEEE